MCLILIAVRYIDFSDQLLGLILSMILQQHHKVSGLNCDLQDFAVTARPWKTPLLSVLTGNFTKTQAQTGITKWAKGEQCGWSQTHSENITKHYWGSVISLCLACTHSLAHHKQTWWAGMHVWVETGGRDDSWPFTKYKTAFTWQTTAEKQACSTSPRRGLFLGEGEYNTLYLDPMSAADKSSLLNPFSCYAVIQLGWGTLKEM